MVESRTCDVLVVGGGATGAGVLRDLARRGLRALLVERSDFGTGTTGRYHGLLHSGGRYAAKDRTAAEECVAENRILRRIAPASIEDTGGFFVATPDDADDYVEKFPAACEAAGVDCDEVPLAEAFRREPALNRKIRRVFRTRDGSVEPWQLIEANVADARQRGSDAWTYQRLVAMERRGSRIISATVRDERSGSLTQIHPRFVVCAAGAWSEQVAAMVDVNVTMHAGKGTMLIYNQRMTDTVINRCHKSSDGDIMVPVHTVAILGTTEERVADPDNYPITREEVAALIREGEKLFPDLGKMRLLRAYAGVRPLYQAPTETTADTLHDGRKISRAHAVLDHGPRDGVDNFVTIVGGKLTTFRRMAQDAVDVVAAKLGVSEPCTTADEILPGQVEGHHYWLGHRLADHEKEGGGDNGLLCECEFVTREMLDEFLTTHPDASTGRRPAWDPGRDGALPGRLLHVPRRRRPRRAGRLDAGAGGGRRSGDPRLPDRALQGNTPDRRRPPTPGAVDGERHLRGGPRGRIADRSGAGRRPATGSARRAAIHPAPSRHPRRSPMPSADIVVVGAGLAGLTAALAAAEGGARVTVLAKGHAATHWGPGGIDVAGVPAAATAREGIGLLAADPRHPYAALGGDVEPALAWLLPHLAVHGAPYAGTLDTPLQAVPTSIGGTRRAAILPEAQAPALGPWAPDERLLVVGFDGFKDFWPDAIAASLARPQVWGNDSQPASVRAIRVTLPSLEGRHNLNALVLGRLFDDPAWRTAAVDAIARAVAAVKGGPGRVALPAVLGIKQNAAVMAALRERLALAPFELPLVPPSLPGMRLYAALRAAVMAHGGRVSIGEMIDHVEHDGERVTAVASQAATRTHTIRTGALVLATGGIAGGGLVAEREGTILETVLGLRVEAPPVESWLSADAWDPAGHPLERAGIRTDAGLRPIAATGTPTFDNVRIAGSLLAGQRYIRERCGDGVAVTSGWRAGRSLVEAGTADGSMVIAAAPAGSARP